MAESSPTLSDLLRALRGPVLLLTIFLFALSSAAASAPGDPPASVTEPEFIRWVATQGGLLVALLMTGWSYRRDLTRVIEEEREKERQRTAALMATLEKSTIALTHMADVVDGCPLRERDRGDRR